HAAHRGTARPKDERGPVGLADGDLAVGEPGFASALGDFLDPVVDERLDRRLPEHGAGRTVEQRVRGEVRKADALIRVEAEYANPGQVREKGHVAQPQPG